MRFSRRRAQSRVTHVQEEPHYLDETLLEPTIALAALAMVVVVQSRVSTPEPGLPEGVRHALETIATETSSSAADQIGRAHV